MRPGTFLSTLPLTLLLTAPVLAAPATPKQGSPERKAVMDAIRMRVQRALKKPVLFKVDHLKVQDNWAFMTGVPQAPGGKKMDYRGTRWATAIREGVFDDWICALLRKHGGKWQVVRYAIGATDVVWDGWDREYKAPRAIFPYPQ